MNDPEPLAALIERATACARAAGVGNHIQNAAPLEGGHSGVTIGADVVDDTGSSRHVVIKAAPRVAAGWVVTT